MSKSRNGQNQSARSFVDNTIALYFARLFMPLLVSGISYLAWSSLADLKAETKNGNEKIWTAISDVGKSLTSQAVDIATLKVKADTSAKQIDNLITVTTTTQQHLQNGR